MDDKELEELELSDDDISDGLDVDGSNYVNSQANSAPSFLSNKKSAARQQIDNKINNIGTEALKKVGVPEPLAKHAVKTNGGIFSPTNMPANKLASNLVRNKLASGLSKVGGKIPGLNKVPGLSNILGNKNKNAENKPEEEKKKFSGIGGLGSKKNDAVKDEMSAGAEAADKAKNIAGAIINTLPPTLKIKIYIIIAAAIAILLILFILFVGISGSKSSDKAAVSSYAATGQASYHGNYYDVQNYLVQAGYCDEENCEDSNAYKYVTKVNEWLSQYNTSVCRDNNYILDDAINLIVSTATYERDVEEYYGLNMTKEEYEEQLEIYLEEYQKLMEASFTGEEISAGENGVITCYKFFPDSYKSYVVSQDGYLDTYRDDLGELTEAEKNSIYDVITGDAEEIKVTIEETKKSSSSSGIVSGGSSMIVSSLCTGVTVTGENAGVYSLDEYIAGVIENENNWYQGNNIENMKAQAVAARTYVLSDTDNCKEPIENSTRKQTFNPNPSEKARQAALETSNQVLVDSAGNYISAEYDAFCYSSKNSSYYTVQNNLQIPTGWVESNISSWKYKNCQCELNDPNITGCWNTTSSGTVWADGGHGRGMSQWGSRYLQTLGYTYDEILSTFYEDSTLKTLGNSVTSGIPNNVNDLKNRYYFNFDKNIYQGNTLFGQCVWYAKHRAMEILASTDIELGKKNILIESIKNTPGHGKDWYNNPDGTLFKKSPNINDAKAGSIISWNYCKNYGSEYACYGHVAIVEKVEVDSSGNITVTITEGYRTQGENGFYVTSDLWSVVNVQQKKMSLYQILHRYDKYSGGRFNGYVYLY